MRKNSTHIPKGMTKDLSASKFNSDYYYDALNIKLTTSDSNTLMSITNVKSNSKIALQFLDKYGNSIEGCQYIGHVVLNNYITVFAIGDPEDYIYRINTDDDYSVSLLAQGNFNFSPEYPIEGIGIYEKEEAQKVYWIDGINQPRVINIVANNGIIEDSTYLDFVRVLQLDEKVNIKRNATTIGFITAGTIQYVFTYYNLYGQESNIFYHSPLYYISYNNRGASPEDTSISTSFTITLDNLDTSFDYIRIYSIHRSSTNATPDCKRVIDLPTSNNPIIYVDDGSKGDTVDPTLLLYIGGREIIPYTMDHKDNTLFFGNYKEKGSIIPEELKTSIRDSEIMFVADKQLEVNKEKPTTNFYSYRHQLSNNSQQITTYKYGEVYRFGVQLQKPTGEWSEPIYITDAENDKHPVSTITSQTTNLVEAKKVLDSDWVNKAIAAGYVKARPLVVFPSMVDRTVICQGILNPTVFNVSDRATNSPFAQASWFFRPSYKSFNKDLGSVSPYSNMVNYLFVALAQQDDLSNFATRGTFVDVIREDGLVIGKYSHYGVIRLTSQSDSADGFYVAVLKMDRGYGVKHIEGTQLTVPYYLVANNNYNKKKQIRVSEEIEGTEDLEVDMWETGIPTGLNKLSSTGFLIWDSESKWVSNSFSITYKGYTETWATAIADNDSSITIPGTQSQFVNYTHLPYSNNRSAEIQCNYIDVADGETDPLTVALPNPDDRSKYIDRYSDMFFVDQSIVTLNSPEIDFDTSMQSIDEASLKLRVVGYIPITATVGDIDLSTSTTQLNYYQTAKVPRGFWHEMVGQADPPGFYSMNTAPMWFDEVYGNATKNTTSLTAGFLIYPWHRSGSLNNQPSAIVEEKEATELGKEVGYRSAMLQNKVMSNLRFSANTIYNESFWDAGDISVGLFNFDEVSNVRMEGQSSYDEKPINYYGNIDKVLVSSRNYTVTNSTSGESSDVMGYPIFASERFRGTDEGKYHQTLYGAKIVPVSSISGIEDSSGYYGFDPIHMKYKSGPHAVICIKGHSNTVEILPRFHFMDDDASSIPSAINGRTFWANNVVVHQDIIDAPSNLNYGYLWVGELYNDNHSEDTRFGGKSDDAIESNTWIPAGDAVRLVSGKSTELVWSEGDTYYQRYDCLKTYPFTKDDTNAIVDICSCMLETRVNIDGRYDRNRGQLSNFNMTPQNFNLMNTGYTQNNNFFNYNILDQNLFNNAYYPNYITWSKTKTPGEKIDTWTNVTLANVLDMDGDKGSIQALKRFNNTLFCFQDKGISQVLYNEQTQISTTNGVPIEIANSGKVQGKRYITETVGCQNKWSIATSPYGLYFIDANNKTINRLSQSIEDLTHTLGFDSWAENNIELGIWDVNRKSNGVYRTLYDGNNKDVFFIGNHSVNDCLVYSETMNQFTSFYSWNKALSIFNVDDKLLSFEDSSSLNLYEQYAGDDYCNYYGTQYPFYVTYIDAQDPLNDKVYTNVEFRATVEGDGVVDGNKFTPYLPFDVLDIWNEYQHGIAHLKNKNGSESMQHHLSDSTATLKRKFRMWRCDIPRDNAELSSDEGLGISRYKKKPVDRIRNPWVYMKLLKETDTQRKTELHDLVISYFL